MSSLCFHCMDFFPPMATNKRNDKFFLLETQRKESEVSGPSGIFGGISRCRGSRVYDSKVLNYSKLQTKQNKNLNAKGSNINGLGK